MSTGRYSKLADWSGWQTTLRTDGIGSLDFTMIGLREIQPPKWQLNWPGFNLCRQPCYQSGYRHQHVRNYMKLYYHPASTTCRPIMLLAAAKKII